MEKTGKTDIREDNKSRKVDILYEAGFGHYPKVIARMREVGGTDKQILYTILEKIREKGTGASFPSVSTIAWESGCSVRTVQVSIHKWKELKIIEWINEDGRSNEYIINELPEWITEKYSMSKEKLNKTIQESLEKTRQLHKEKKMKRVSGMVMGKDKDFGKEKEKKNTDYLEFQKVYATQFLKRYPKELLPQWTGKEAGQMKSFIKSVGGLDVAISIMEYIFKNWKDLADDWKLDVEGYPTMSILMGYGRGLSTKVVKRKKKSDLKYTEEDDFEIIEH